MDTTEGLLHGNFLPDTTGDVLAPPGAYNLSLAHLEGQSNTRQLSRHGGIYKSIPNITGSFWSACMFCRQTYPTAKNKGTNSTVRIIPVSTPWGTFMHLHIYTARVEGNKWPIHATRGLFQTFLDRPAGRVITREKV